MVLKVVLPKLTPQTKPFANALKVILATLVAGVKFQQIPGDAVTVETNNGTTLTDANVAVK